MTMWPRCCSTTCLPAAASAARVGVALPEGQRGEKVYEQSGKTVKIG
ncbi:MAG: hypothetical protein IPF39_00605 [Comamonadaceae bacterium]|nr:hypothetical protein [Comamonadaceae bacterium]